MEDKTQQEMEFRAWGLSKIAVRNIVVFFILTLLMAISILSRVIHVQYLDIKDLNQKILETQYQGSTKYEQLQNENLKTVLRLNELLLNQREIKQEIRDAKSTLNEVEKSIRR